MTHILIGEDDFDLRTIVSDFLTATGYQVSQVSNGEEVLKVLANHLPDLLILDLSMPKMDGWSVLQSIRALPKAKNLPVIAFTAHASTAAREKAEAAGCDGFVTKPFNPNDLLQEVRRLIASRAAA